MLPQQIYHILVFFDAFGFNSGSTHLSKYQKIIYLAHILLAMMFVLLEIKIIFEYYPLLALTESISEFLQYFAALSTYWLTIFDSVLQQRNHRHFWLILERIDISFCGQQSFKFRNYLVKFIVYSIKTVVVIVLRLVFSLLIISVIADLAYTFLPIICEIRMFYYLFCLEVIHYQLNMVEKELIVMQRSFNVIAPNQLFQCSILKASPFYTLELQRLKWIRDYFHCIYTMIDLLNNIFGWSHVAAISYCFYYTLTEINWLYLNFRNISYIRNIGKRSMHKFVLK